MTHIEVLDIETLKLGSDHRAVIYHCRVRSRPWTIITYNMGGKATAADIEQLLQLAHFATPGRWTLCLQETGDQRKTLQRVVDVVNGEPGAQVELVQGEPGLGRSKLATIVPLGTLVTDGLVELSPRSWIGKRGAGPSWLSPKYLLRTRQRVGTGKALRVGNVHFVPSALQRLMRRPLHRRQLRGALAWAQLQPDVATAIIGDFNATPTSPLMRDARRSPLTLHAPDRSHGNRAIDLLLTS